MAEAAFSFHAAASAAVKFYSIAILISFAVLEGQKSHLFTEFISYPSAES